MKVNTMIRSLKKTRYALLLLPFFQLSYANLTIETAQTIQGTKPRLSDALETSLINTGELKPLFGLHIDNKSYYSDEEIAQMPVPTSYPFMNRFTPALIKQPNENEYFDRDGDKLSFLSAIDGINMEWYYTDAQGKELSFTPRDSDTFCSLASDGKFAPFKVKLSADLVLVSEYGDPDFTTYPNDVIKNQPSATFTIIEDVGICYARPELSPNNVPSSNKSQWNQRNGFLAQSNVDPTKNFPTTGFVGAKFDLILSQNNLYADYDWYVKQGSDLVTVTKSARTNIPTVTFNGPDANDTGKAWEHVMGGSGNGYLVVIEGKNTKTDRTIQYAFTITKWFDVWKQELVNNRLRAVRGSVAEVVEGCESKSGHYRVSQINDISDAIETATSQNVYITREIGSLISEWGDVDQDNYPGSFGPQRGNANKRFYVYNPGFNDDDGDADGAYCDIHLNDGRFHCREKEREHKNAVCASFKP